MQIIDLTHNIEENISVFPGTALPRVELVSTLEKEGYREHRLAIWSHTGTHVDAPFHMLAQGETIDSLAVSNFVGVATLIDFTQATNAEITIEDLEKYTNYLNQSDFLILSTGWSQYWGSPKYLESYPTLSVAAAQWLTQFNLKGIGIDAISIDPIESTTFSLHQLFLAQGLVIFENLTNLGQVPIVQFNFVGLPLKLKGGDGSPIRAIAMIDG